jgi:23S rRNA pseudouridine1911/1915/1917 synthase
MAQPVRVVYEDDALIVIDKPAGMAVHAAATEKKHEPTLVDWLLKQYPEVAKVGEDALRPGIVHRLDRDTSGVMVIARTPDAFAKLKAAFKDRTVSKRYVALVYGRVPWDTKSVELSIVRTGSGTFGARHPNDVAVLQKKNQQSGGEGSVYRPALTDFVVLKRFTGSRADKQAGEMTLLEAHPKTGRTHQIRVHLKALGFPVVGDQLYAPKKLVAATKAAGLGRHFLHAAELRFVHPVTKKGATYEALLAPELQKYLDGLTHGD